MPFWRGRQRFRGGVRCADSGRRPRWIGTDSLRSEPTDGYGRYVRARTAVIARLIPEVRRDDRSATPGVGALWQERLRLEDDPPEAAGATLSLDVRPFEVVALRVVLAS